MTGSKYQAYPEYKESGVEWLGSIPSHWKLFDGKRIFENRRGLAFAGDQQLAASQKYGVVPQSLMMELNDSKVMLALKGTNSFRHVEENDFVISLRSFEGGIEYSAYRGCVSPAYTVLNSIKNISPSFYRYLFKSKSYVAALQSTTDSLRDGKSITYQQFGAIPLVVPTEEEQTQIANFLDLETGRIDNLIEKQQQLIKLLTEKRQAVISHAVTKGLNPDAPIKDSGIEYLREVPEHWISKIKLINFAEGNRGSFVNGPFGSDLLSDELTEEGVPVIYIRDLKHTGYKRKSTVCVTLEKSKKLEVCRATPGDVLIAKVGDPPGESCVYPTNEIAAIITQDVIRIRVNRKSVNPYYLTMLLNSDFGKLVIGDISVESTRKRISLGDFKGVRLVLPPLYEQENIVSFVDIQCKKIDTLIDNSQAAIDLVKERRAALISAAVTGKIDVRNWQPPQEN